MSTFVWWCYSLWWISNWSYMEKFGFRAPWEMISSVLHLPQWVLEHNSCPEQMLFITFYVLSKRSKPPLPQSPDFNYRDECPLSHGIALVQGVQPWTGSVPAPCPLNTGRNGQAVYSASHHVRLWGHLLSISRQLCPDYHARSQGCVAVTTSACPINYETTWWLNSECHCKWCLHFFFPYVITRHITCIKYILSGTWAAVGKSVFLREKETVRD